MNVPLKIGQKSSTCSTRYYYFFCGSSSQSCFCARVFYVRCGQRVRPSHHNKWLFSGGPWKRIRQVATAGLAAVGFLCFWPMLETRSRPKVIDDCITHRLGWRLLRAVTNEDIVFYLSFAVMVVNERILMVICSEKCWIVGKNRLKISVKTFKNLFFLRCGILNKGKVPLQEIFLKDFEKIQRNIIILSYISESFDLG